MLKLYRETLDTERKKVFKKISFFKKYGVLAGGTALALQLGHRRSFDFDIFLPKPISRQFFKKVVKVFGEKITTRVSTGDILMIETEGKAEVHFVYVWHKRLEKTVKTETIDLASVKDIAADKAQTIGRRGEWRDYVDVFFLLKKKIFNLEEIIKLAQRKYRPEFSPRMFLEQLSYFDDINDFRISFFKKTYKIGEVKNFLEKEAREFKDKDLFC